MRRILIIIFAIVIVILLMLLFWYKRAPHSAVPNKTIDDAVKQFARLMDPEIINDFGFRTSGEIANLKAGKQFDFYTINLKDIGKFKAGDNFSKMIKYYPTKEIVLVDTFKNIRASIKFVYDAGTWKVARYGFTPEMVTLKDAANLIADSVIQKSILVRLPAIGTCFLAMPENNYQYLYVIDDNPIWGGYKPGDRVLTNDAILRIVSRANRMMIMHP